MIRFRRRIRLWCHRDEAFVEEATFFAVRQKVICHVMPTATQLLGKSLKGFLSLLYAPGWARDERKSTLCEYIHSYTSIQPPTSFAWHLSRLIFHLLPWKVARYPVFCFEDCCVKESFSYQSIFVQFWLELLHFFLAFFHGLVKRFHSFI